MKINISPKEWYSVYRKYWTNRKYIVITISAENIIYGSQTDPKIYKYNERRKNSTNNYCLCYIVKFFKIPDNIQLILKQEFIIHKLSDVPKSIHIIFSPSGKQYQVVK